MRLPRFIIFAFDALRRDMITEALAPTLRRFLDDGCDFPLSRCVFPSVTRVNAAALGCGAAPGSTGITANKFFDGKVFGDKLVHTGLYDHIEAAERTYRGRFVAAESLGDVLARNGMKMAVVSTGSAGTTHLLNPRAAALGHLTLCLSDWRASTPGPYAESILQRFGPIPAAARPNVDRIVRQTDIAIEAVIPEWEPDVLVMWFADPDTTYHHCGIGSPESLEAIRNIDRQFARVLQLWRASRDSDRCQIFVCSDHGQITGRDRIHVQQSLRQAGIAMGSAFSDEQRIAGSAAYYGAISVAGGDMAEMKRLVLWLLEQSWCGHVFTPGGDGLRGSVPGTLDRALLMVGAGRAPELYYTMRTREDTNEWGVRGTCFFDSDEVPAGGGVHGGLHPIEMNNLLAAQGSLFRSRYASPWPASHIDIVPTIVHALELRAPGSMTGRVLGEALVETGFEPPAPETLECSVEAGAYRQCFRSWRVGKTTYIDQGWIEAARP